TLKAVILLAEVHVEILGGEADVLAELPLQARADRPSDVVVFGRSKAVCVFARLASVVDWNDRRLDPRPGKATSCIRKQAVIKEIADAATSRTEIFNLGFHIPRDRVALVRIGFEGVALIKIGNGRVDND